MTSCVLIIAAAVGILALTLQPTSAQVFSTLCPSVGLFHNPTDCAAYYECSEGRAVPFFKRCGPGTLFNHISQQCDWVRNVNCNRNNIQPVILTNPIAATVVQPRPLRPRVSVSISNPFGRLNINAAECNNISRALSATLQNQVSVFDPGCGQNCLQALPSFLVICNQ